MGWCNDRCCKYTPDVSERENKWQYYGGLSNTFELNKVYVSFSVNNLQTQLTDIGCYNPNRFSYKKQIKSFIVKEGRSNLHLFCLEKKFSFNYLGFDVLRYFYLSLSYWPGLMRWWVIYFKGVFIGCLHAINQSLLEWGDGEVYMCRYIFVQTFSEETNCKQWKKDDSSACNSSCISHCSVLVAVCLCFPLPVW